MLTDDDRDVQWLTSGHHVAGLMAGLLREHAEDDQ